MILGTAAVRDPALVRQACARFPGKIAVGVDAKDGRWRCRAGLRRPSFPPWSCAPLRGYRGVRDYLSDIGRDGMLTGLNLDATAEIARAVKTP